MERVAMNIKAEMARTGATRAVMAKALDITPWAWDKLLQDPETRISIGRMRVIAAKLKTTPFQLMEV